MRTRVIELKIKKESKERLSGGRFLNVTVQKERRGGYRRGEGSEEKRRESRGKEEERIKAKSNILPKNSGME